jgi:hypothetical protein
MPCNAARDRVQASDGNGLVYPSQDDTMIDHHLARAHRNNIQRYHLLLQTNLTECEREFVERRLSEEQSKLERLVSSCSSEAHCDQSGAPGTHVG